MSPARHEVVACAFGCRPSEHWGLDVDKPLCVEELTHGPGNARPSFEPREHLGTAQVDIPESQTRIFADVQVTELKRRRTRDVQDFQALPEHLDGTGGHLGVDRTLGPLAHAADGTQDVLGPNLLCNRERLDGIGVVHHLHEPGAITQIDEDHPPVGLVAGAPNRTASRSRRRDPR